MITIGSHHLPNPVVLAPMSGVTDLPFRRACAREGAGMVVSEMVASEELSRNRADVSLRAALDAEIGIKVVQLAGRDPYWMGEGAKIAEDRGADVIDINMGCPARKVTGGQSGSALMREPERALALIEAVVEATSCPVTVKMRLGWDHDDLNAPTLARQAEAAGAQLITVHGRTRCQFYTGTADWHAVGATVEAVSVPVIVNGDIVDDRSARLALEYSGADGVMIGRAAEGRPWMPGALAEALKTGNSLSVPSASEQARQMADLHREIVAHYRTGHQQGEERGQILGLRTARKHLAAFADSLPDLDEAARKSLRGRLCQSVDEADIRTAILEAGEGNVRLESCAA